MSTYSIGIDIGATNTDIGLVRNDGTVMGHHILKTQEYEQTDAYIRDITHGIRQLMQDHAISAIDGIGIGAPNANFFNGCIEENTVNLRIKERIPLRALLTESFQVPIVVDNDANAAAYGEHIYGGAKEMRHFIMLTLGTGVGSGIVIDNQILHGHTGTAGELGHAIVNPMGRRCHCGRIGCIEAYACAQGICDNYIEEWEKGEIKPLLEPEDVSTVTCQFIGESAVKGDPLAMKAYDTTAYWLGIALANAAAFSAPEAIFLMGGPTRAGEALMKPLRHYFEEHLLYIYKGKISVQLSLLNSNDAAILGAAALSKLIY